MARRPVIIAAIAVAIVAPGSAATAASDRQHCPSLGMLAATRLATAAIDTLRADGCGTRTAVREAGPNVPVVGGVWVTDPVWSPNGDSLAYGVTDFAYAATTTEIRIAPVRGGAKATIITLPLVGSIQDLAWSPDGRRFAFSLFTYNYPALIATWSPFGSTERVYVINSDGTGLRPISTVNASFDNEPRWAPDSRYLAYTSWLLGVIVVDANAAAPVPHLVSPPTLAGHSASWSPDGRRIAFTASNLPAGTADVWVVHADGSGARRVLTDGGEAAWSPDGRILATGGGSTGGLWTVHPNGKGYRELITDPVGRPSWSSDGRLLAFTRVDAYGNPNAYDKNAVWVIRPDGTGAHRVSTPTELGYSTPVWRPR